MNYKALTLSAVLVSGLMSGSAALAANANVKQMAGILSHLNHYPSDAEKEALDAIVVDRNASQAERTIAAAMMHMRHHVSDSDREHLTAIAQNGNVDKDTRELAGILASINHHPSQGDVTVLHAMTR